MTRPPKVISLLVAFVGLVAAQLMVASPASAATNTIRLLAGTGVGCLSAKVDGSQKKAYAPNCNDGPYQQWRETQINPVYTTVILANQQFNQCLHYGSVSTGVVLKPCDTQESNQRWQRYFVNDVDPSRGTVYINSASGRCLRAPTSTNGLIRTKAYDGCFDFNDLSIVWYLRR